MVLVFILWLGCAALGYAIGNPKGRGTDGVLLGLLLGLIGVIIIAVLQPKVQPTPLNYYDGPVNGGQVTPPALLTAPPVVAAPPPAPLPPEGWYPDPYGQGDTRWWNGRTWTSELKR